MQNIFIDFLPPWVETGLQPAFYDKESGTVLQQVARMYAKVNQLVKAFDDLDEATVTTVNDYISRFTELKDYVDNYFDNLDVQEEINNKLDEMAESGELADIISQYLNSTAIFGYDTVADMKSAENLVNGSYARTIGYHAKNDGGGALYKIRTVTNDDVEDDAFIIAMADNTLVAEMIIEDEVDIRSLGARSQKVDDTKYDIAPYITKYLNRLDILANSITLKIPAGVWYSSPLTIHRTNGFRIIGDEQFIHWTNGGTIISSLNDNQSYIFTLGDGTEMVSNFVFKNICFSSADFEYDEDSKKFITSVNDIKTITGSCLKIQGCMFGDTDNLYFQHIDGNALSISSCWEIRYRKLYFRDVDARNSSVVLFAPKIGISLRPVTTTNASMMDNVMFESTLGDLFATKTNSEVSNFHFGVINFEDNNTNRSDITFTKFTNDNIATYEASTHHSYSVFHLAENTFIFNTISIGSIELDQFSTYFTTINSENYCYDNIFRIDGNDGNFGVVVNTVTCHDINKNAKILVSKVNHLSYDSLFILNNLYVISKPAYHFSYDVEYFTYIRHDGRVKNAGNTFDCRLPHNASPAYELVPNKDQGMRYLLSDSDSGTEPQLCVKVPTSGVAIGFKVLSTSFKVCAKIPNGETAKIALNRTGGQQVEDLAGTGSFKVYDITLGGQFIMGEDVTIGFKTGNTASSMLIDYIIN